MIKKIIFMLIMCSFITSCKKEEIKENKIEQIVEAIKVTQNTNIKDRFDLYLETDFIFEKYEPKNGSYLGAYIEEDASINKDIKEFEKRTDTSHASYIHNIFLGEELSEEFILNCISNNKIPNIRVDISNGSLSGNTVKIEELAKQFSKYNIPMFLQFAPFKSSYNSAEYVDMFTKAKYIFSTQAPKVAFIWVVSEDNAAESLRYYPGDKYVDWVGIDMLQREDYSYGPIDFIYYTFQSKKPMMITKFMVSHFNSLEGYKIEESVKNFDMYNQFKKNYPRIKAVYYRDYNETMENVSNGITTDESLKIKGSKSNFSITEDEKISKIYKDAIDTQYYLNKLENHYNEVYTDVLKSPFELYIEGQNILISEKSLKYDLLYTPSSFIQNKIIDNEKYFNILDIEKNIKGVFIIDRKNKKVVYES